MTSCSKCDKSNYCSGLCRPCYKRDNYLKNKEKVLSRQKQYRLDNPELLKEIDHKKYLKRKDKVEISTKNWQSKNKEKVKGYKAKYRETHRKIKMILSEEELNILNLQKLENKREYNRNYQRKWAKTEAGKLCKRVSCASRRAKKKMAQPDWVDTKELTKIYKNCPKGMEVDHILPLQGKQICGLHVPWNLQYLTRSENAKKNAKLILP